MNLLIVHNHYRISGGEDTVVSNEYALLKDMGHNVTLYERHNDEIRGLNLLQKLCLPLKQSVTFYISSDRPFRRSP